MFAAVARAIFACCVRRPKPTAAAARVACRRCATAATLRRFGHARDCEQWNPGAESRRLVAVCALLNGDWSAARAATVKT